MLYVAKKAAKKIVNLQVHLCSLMSSHNLWVKRNQQCACLMFIAHCTYRIGSLVEISPASPLWNKIQANNTNNLKIHNQETSCCMLTDVSVITEKLRMSL